MAGQLLLYSREGGGGEFENVLFPYPIFTFFTFEQSGQTQLIGQKSGVQHLGYNRQGQYTCRHGHMQARAWSSCFLSGVNQTLYPFNARP